MYCCSFSINGIKNLWLLGKSSFKSIASFLSNDGQSTNNTQSASSLHQLLKSDGNNNYSYFNQMIKMQKTLSNTNKSISVIIKQLTKYISKFIGEEKYYQQIMGQSYTILMPTMNNKKNNCKTIFSFKQWAKYKKVPLVFNESQEKYIITSLLLAKNSPHSVQLFLYGKPGTGKTHIAHLLKDFTHKKVLMLSVSNLVRLGPKYALRAFIDILEYTKKNKIWIFIDEVEILFTNRSLMSNNCDSSESTILLKDLLSIFLSYTGNKAIKVIAATNRAGIIDDAIRRRFERIIPMELPDCSCRKKIFQNYFKSYNIKLFNKQSDVDNITGEISEGLSGSDIQTICRLLSIQGQSGLISIDNLLNLVKNMHEKYEIFNIKKNIQMMGSINKNKDYDVVIEPDSLIAINDKRVSNEMWFLINNFRYFNTYFFCVLKVFAPIVKKENISNLILFNDKKSKINSFSVISTNSNSINAINKLIDNNNNSSSRKNKKVLYSSLLKNKKNSLSYKDYFINNEEEQEEFQEKSLCVKNKLYINNLKVNRGNENPLLVQIENSFV